MLETLSEAAPAPPLPSRSWEASLALDFARKGVRTVMSREHSGPLMVQKALYPEGDAVCHALLIHPPGGIAGGDALQIAVSVGPDAHALVTTPGATRWYKAAGARASQRVALRVAGTLEWLPQEAIVFDEAEVRSTLEIDLAPGAAMIGWDRIALGRVAAGERFTRGSFRQSIRLREQGRLCWHELARIDGGDALLSSPIGLAGRHVFGCLWAWRASAWTDEDLDALRTECDERGIDVPLTRVQPQLLIARQITASTAELGARFEALWAVLRPRVAQLAVAERPRIWTT